MANAIAPILSRFVLLFSIFFLKDISFAFSQLKNTYFERLSVKNGLSHNYATAILQDKDGFYWIATNDGLNRFDGSAFTVFRYNKNDSFGITHNVCSYLLEGKDGDIWIATMKGINRYSKKTGVFKKYFLHHPKINDDILNRIYGFAMDKEGNIWATGYGLWKIDAVTDSITGYYFDANNSRSVSDGGETTSLYYDTLLNGLWFQTPDHVNFFDIGSAQFFHSTNNPKRWRVFDLPNKNIAMAADGKAAIWMYDELQKKLYHLDNPLSDPVSVSIFFPKSVANIKVNTKEGDDLLLFNFDLMPALFYNWKTNKTDTMPAPFGDPGDKNSRLVHSVYTDREGNTWYCTRAGIAIAAKHYDAIKIFHLPNTAEGFPLATWSMANDGHEGLWLGTKNGLLRYNIENNGLQSMNSPLLNATTRALYNDGDSVLWISTSGKKLLLLHLRSNKISRTIEIPGNGIFLLADRQGHIWLGTWNQGLLEFDNKGNLLHHYTSKNGLAYDGLIGAWYDGNNELWVGMNGGNGFARFDLKNRQFSNYLITTKLDNSVGSNTVNTLLKDGQGKIWLGTYGGGLYCFDTGKNVYSNYRQADGLSGDFVNTLQLDGAGNLWISTTKGIDMLDIKSGSISRLNIAMEFDDNGYINNKLLSTEGKLFYSANNKIILIRPSQFAGKMNTRQILLSSFKVFDKEIPALANQTVIRLRYNENFFTVNYSMPKISPEIPAKYRYILRGFDKNWRTALNGIANYTNVPPGTYTLLLDATNETGKWLDRPREISIIVSPPFWKTWWFYTLLLLLIMGSVIGIVRTRVNRVRKNEREQLRLIVATQEKEKKNISAGLHDDLGVRLSALKYFVASLKPFLQKENPSADDTYKKTMATIDESVEDIRYLLINLSPKTLDEYGYLLAVEDLVNKLGRLHVIEVNLRQKGMEQRLQQEIESGLYRITQELINNTLKHAEANTINLSIEKINNHIHLQYSDDGKGFDLEKEKQGYGVENIYTRVALLNGKIEWGDASRAGTAVHISVPIHT